MKKWKKWKIEVRCRVDCTPNIEISACKHSANVLPVAIGTLVINKHPFCVIITKAKCLTTGVSICEQLHRVLVSFAAALGT